MRGGPFGSVLWHCSQVGRMQKTVRTGTVAASLAAEIALWHLFSKQIADPGFAIRAAASSFQIRQSGLFGCLVSFSATLRDSLCRLERFSTLLSNAVKWHVETEAWRRRTSSSAT